MWLAFTAGMLLLAAEVLEGYLMDTTVKVAADVWQSLQGRAVTIRGEKEYSPMAHDVRQVWNCVKGA